MQIKKVLILIAMACLLPTTINVKAQPQLDEPQWEYATYATLIIPGAEKAYRWDTPYEHIYWSYEFNDTDSCFKFWHMVGFEFGYKNVSMSDWFNFLGQQGWQLFMTSKYKDDTYYWFKRQK